MEGASGFGKQECLVYTDAHLPTEPVLDHQELDLLYQRKRMYACSCFLSYIVFLFFSLKALRFGLVWVFWGFVA